MDSFMDAVRWCVGARKAANAAAAHVRRQIPMGIMEVHIGRDGKGNESLVLCVPSGKNMEASHHNAISCLVRPVRYSIAGMSPKVDPVDSPHVMYV